MKRDKIIYWTTTGIVAGAMLMGSFMYLSKNAELLARFQQIEIPLYLVPLLGFAKLAGAIVLVIPVWNKLKEWAYAGFAFTFLGAVWTHISTGTPFIGPAVFLILLTASYLFWTRVRKA